MANQEWITNEGSLGIFNEGSPIQINDEPVYIEYIPSTNINRKTLKPIIVSSNLPNNISIVFDEENNKIRIGYPNEYLPEILEDTTYYITLRLIEVVKSNTSEITDITERLFSITNKNIPIQWSSDESKYQINCFNGAFLNFSLKSCLDHANGNEIFKKSDGDLPDGISLDDNGDLYGIAYLNSDVDETYNFNIKVFANGEEILINPEEPNGKYFTITVKNDSESEVPQWETEEYLGNINKNQSANILIKATVKTGVCTYSLKNESSVLPNDLEFSSNNGYAYITGTCITPMDKEYTIDVIATAPNGNTNERTFKLTTNKNSEHSITWIDSDVYEIGTYNIGENISSEIPHATTIDGSTITYSFSGDYPKGLQIKSTGILYGIIEYQIPKTYEFDIMASTPYVYTTRKFRINVKKGLGENAIKLYLKINLEYKDEYNEIKNQFNPNTKYNSNVSNYNVDVFPKIDVATLTCFDKEVLAHKLKFGNPEIVRFGLTKSIPYSHVDQNETVTASYDVLYKSIDENTYQWDEIKCGDYPFDEKLNDLIESNEKGDADLHTKLDFNNTVYNTSVQYFDEESKSIKTSTTTPSYSYSVFNFKNVRNILSEKIYVYQKEGTYIYDEGSQQILGESNSFTSKKLYSKTDDTSSHVYGRSRKDIVYYISDIDGLNEQRVDYKNHFVYIYNTDTILNNLIFKQNDGTSDFIIINGEIYNVGVIENPWCYDFNENERLDNIPVGAEMVLPYIKEVETDGKYFIRFLDTNVEPLPEWKREQPVLWKAKTTYKAKTIIFYESLYYKVKQEFTSGNVFTYDTNVLELISGSDIDTNLPKNYFPSLDLGYYQRNTNNNYLKVMNNEELKGKFWYRKDFLFWDIIAEPVFNEEIGIFGIPFYSNENILSTINNNID